MSGPLTWHARRYCTLPTQFASEKHASIHCIVIDSLQLVHVLVHVI